MHEEILVANAQINNPVTAPGKWQPGDFLTTARIEAIWGYLFILPSFALVFIFVLYPVISGFYYSLTDWNMISEPSYVGIDNYTKILNDDLAITTIKNTIIYSGIGVPLGIIISLLLAMALNQKVRGITFYRSAYYLPVITSTVAISIVFRWIFNSDHGLLNQLLVQIGIDPVRWLLDPDIALYSLVGVTVWRGLGLNMIIYLAALQDVPKELYEAASLDGAGAIQKFLKITVPLITPALFFTSITGVIGSLQSFDLVYNMTEGGPGTSTYLVGYYIWQQAFSYLRMGYGAALAFVLFFVIFILTVIQWRARKAWVYGEETN
jgi:multiple sugar transport system permease protein